MPLICLGLTRHLNTYLTRTTARLTGSGICGLTKCVPRSNLSTVTRARANRPLNLRPTESLTASLKLSNIAEKRDKCWKCGRPVATSRMSLLCGYCHALQAMDSSLNYFDLFELKTDFDVDLNVLSDKLKSLQKATHPDRYAMSCETEYNISVNNSSLVNKGYKTLRDPYERGLYLLKLLDESIEESHTSGDTGIDSQFLSDIMELNEEIEESESKQSLLTMFEANKRSIDESVVNISDAFRTGDAIRAKGLLAKYKFLLTADTNLKQKLEKS